MGGITEHGHPFYPLNGNGKPYGVPHVEGKPCTSSTPHSYDIAMGKVAGNGYIRALGRNSDVGATPETIWSAGGLYPWPVSAEVLKISSDSVNDDGTLSGSGARTVRIFGCDSDCIFQEETITLNGSIPVATQLEYLRIYKARVLSAGDAGWNEGLVSIKDNANVVTLLVVEPVRNESLMALFTIPAGFTGRITSFVAATSSNKIVNAELYIRPYGEVFQCKAFVEINQNPYKEPWEFPEPIDGKSDIELRASTAGGGGAVSGGFSLWYEAN